MLHVKNSSWIQNIAANGGGAAYLQGLSFIRTSRLENNLAASGGGMLLSNGVHELSNSSLSRNTALSGGGGGVKVQLRSHLKCEACIISDNNAKGKHGTGGGIYASAGSRVEIVDNTKISGNVAHSGGGMSAVAAAVKINGAEISTNVAVEGGGLAWSCSNCRGVCNETQIVRAAFVGNTAVGGGALYEGSDCGIGNRWPGLQLALNSKAHSLSSGLLSNVADYGVMVASIPVTIHTEHGRIWNGEEIPVAGLLGSLRDRYNQRLKVRKLPPQTEGVALLNGVSIECHAPPSAHHSVEGNILAVIIPQTGLADFAGLIIRARVGASVDLIMETKNLVGAHHKLLFSLNLERCRVGSIPPPASSHDACITCEPGTYSVQEDATACSACEPGAVCPGGSYITAEVGHWNAPGTLLFYPCLFADSCPGGYSTTGPCWPSGIGDQRRTKDSGGGRKGPGGQVSTLLLP